VLHRAQGTAVAPFLGGQAGSFRLSGILVLIARFEPAHHGENVPGADPSRKPTQCEHAKTSLVSRHGSAIFSKQPCPSGGMSFLGFGELLENTGAGTVLFGGSKRAVQRDSVLFAKVVIRVSLEIFPRRGHVRIRRSWLFG
jgi:hypothetical protein